MAIGGWVGATPSAPSLWRRVLTLALIMSTRVQGRWGRVIKCCLRGQSRVLVGRMGELSVDATISHSTSPGGKIHQPVDRPHVTESAKSGRGGLVSKD